MASACNFVGILGLDDGIQFMPADKRHYWKHDAYIPMPSGDFPAEMFIYGGPESTAVDKGIYFVAARALLAPSANVHEDDASLQLYANCVCSLPFGFFRFLTSHFAIRSRSDCLQAVELLASSCFVVKSRVLPLI